MIPYNFHNIMQYYQCFQEKVRMYMKISAGI